LGDGSGEAGEPVPSHLRQKARSCGWLTAAWPVVVANAITLTLALCMLVLKLRSR